VIEPTDIKTKTVSSLPRYDADYKFVQLLISGNGEALDRFYKEFRKKLDIYIRGKYPYVFSDIAIEEICDGVGKRLIEKDCRVLRDYRGDCTFSTYITMATDWETKDWLRKHSEELFSEPLDTLSSTNPALISKNASDQLSSLQETENNIPQAVEFLSDDLRWAFLLRYYDYFEFPLQEIRLLAKKRGVTIGFITKKIIDYLEPGGIDALRSRLEKQRIFQLRLEKICYEINRLSKREILTGVQKDDRVSKDSSEKDFIRNRRAILEEKRRVLLEKAKMPVTTPYDIIAKILGEDNISTVRSRVFLAKKQLKQKVFKEINNQ